MKPTHTKKENDSKSNVLGRLKAHLMLGRRITALEALKKWNTMRLAEYIRVLRHEKHMNIKMVMVCENGKHFGEYYLEKGPKKESRIVNRAYIKH